MKVLVTGATGFIGSYVIEELLKRGHSVVATATSEEKAASKAWFSKVAFASHSIGEEGEEDLFNKFGRPDKMIHLAWQGLPNYKAPFHFEENLPRQYFFLKKLVAQGLKDITVTGTCYEYGMKTGCLPETMVPDPANSYAIAKNSLRLFLEQLQQQHPFVFKWARLFYMYGEGQHPNSLLPQLKRALDAGDEVFNMSGGMQVRDYLPVEKVAEYIVTIALQDKITGIINCCSGRPITVKQLVEEYLATQQKNIRLNLGYYPYPDYEPMEFWGDAGKLQSISQH